MHCQICGKSSNTFGAPIEHPNDGDTIFCHPWCAAKYEFDKAAWMEHRAGAAAQS